MTEEEIKKEAITPTKTDLLDEAQALSEMSKKVSTLEAQNAELMAAKKKYYDAILNGQTVEDNGPKYRTKDEIRKDLFGRDDKDNMTNLEYATLAVELDDACIREDGESCFLPKGKNVTVTSDERETAVRFHDCLETCIKEADGDPEVFDQALNRRIKKK